MRTPSKSFEALLAGTRHFRKETFAANREAYELAACTPQKPGTLFITCADSRIDPQFITNSRPGQIFVARNVGNLVPPYGNFVGGVSSVIEYAVLALNVDQIVVCGHQDCGAMKGLLNPASTEGLVAVREWLGHAQAALAVTHANTTLTEVNKLDELIDQNVLMQLNHLRTHPSVAGRYAQGKLDLYGWVYNISTGEVRMYDEETRKFKALNPVEA